MLIISTNIWELPLKDFQMIWKYSNEWILKYLTLMKEIYLPILFFINVSAILLINQRYLCLDKFCLHHRLRFFYITFSCGKIKALSFTH